MCTFDLYFVIPCLPAGDHKGQHQGTQGDFFKPKDTPEDENSNLSHIDEMISPDVKYT